MVAICMCPVAGRAHAQRATPIDRLALPTGQVLMCRPTSPTSADSAAVMRVWLLGGEREVYVGHDSSGSPRFMLVLERGRTGAVEARRRAILVRFGTEGASGLRGDLGPEPEWLTEPEIARAKELALWLWTHRC